MENSKNTEPTPGDEIPNTASSSITAGDESLPALPRINGSSRNAIEPRAGDENPGPSSSSTTGGAESPPALQGSSATPSSRPSQIDKDYELACMLQEQEMVFMMLENGVEYEDEDDQVEGEASAEGLNAHAHPAQPAGAWGLAWDLSEAEVASQLMSSFRLDEGRTMSQMNQPNLNFQGNQHYSDFDNPSYEELSALCELVGSVNKGLSEDKIFSLPSISYKGGCTQDGLTDQCVICLLNFEEGDSLVSLSCKHLYHCDCITTWLLENKVCPICNAEVNVLRDGSKSNS